MDIFCKDVKAFAPLNMCEVKFWLHIMKEHSSLNLVCPAIRQT